MQKPNTRRCAFPECKTLGKSLGRKKSGLTRRARWCNFHFNGNGKAARVALNAERAIKGMMI